VTPAPTPKKRAVGYIRVSTPEQAQKGESLDTQRKEIERFARLNRWNLTKVYEDGGFSGAKLERPALKRLMEDARRNNFEVVITYTLSRFARSTRDTLNMVHDLKSYGINLVTVDEKIDLSTDLGQFFLTVLGALAELERTRIKEQTTVNKMARWRDHRCYIGKPPYGYFWNKETKKIEINEEEAKVFRKIINMRLNQGMSYADICIKLEKLGLRGRHGGRWAKPTISGILKNRAYIGEHYVNQYEHDGKKRTGKLKPESEWILFPVPPLLDHATFDRLQAISAFHKVKSKRVGEDTANRWLRDVLECGECGSKVRSYPGTLRKDGSRPQRYACYWKDISAKNCELDGHKKCRLPVIKAEVLEDTVWHRLMLMLNIHGPRSESTLEKLLFDGSVHNNTLAELEEKRQAALARLKEQKRVQKNLSRILANKDLSDDELVDFRSLARKNRDSLARAKEALAAVEAEIDSTTRVAAEQQEALRFLRENRRGLKKLRAELEAFTPAQKKKLVESMLDGSIVLWAGTGPPDGGPWDEKIRFRPNYEILKQYVQNILGKDSLGHGPQVGEG
jgi:site-specific DNA recombinase